MKDKSIWVDVTGYEGLYQINASGQIRRTYKGRPPEIVKQFKRKGRHIHQVHLNKNGKSSSFSAEKILREHLGKIENKAKHQCFEISKILNSVSKHLQVPVEEIVAKRRGKFQVTLAKQIAHKVATEATQLSLSKIGAQIGNTNNTGVTHSCKVLSNLIETDNQIARDYYRILTDVTNDKNTPITRALEKLIPI